MKFWLIVPAAGIGARMQAGRPRQYLQVAGKSILEHTLAVFLDHPQLQRIVLPLSADDDGWPQTALAQDAPCGGRTICSCCSTACRMIRWAVRWPARHAIR